MGRGHSVACPVQCCPVLSSLEISVEFPHFLQPLHTLPTPTHIFLLFFSAALLFFPSIAVAEAARVVLAVCHFFSESLRGLNRQNSQIYQC